jgi:hypothetical protein
MRMFKAFGMAMLVAVLVVGTAMMVSAKDVEEASVSVNASFSIPSWLSLSIVGNGDVSFADITGPGTYAGSNDTELRVLSTTSWVLSSEILWGSSKLPSGASQATIEHALGLDFDATSGSWGIHLVTVDYEFTVNDAEELATLPTGDYNLVIQYTATTD